MTLFEIFKLATGPMVANTIGKYGRARKTERPIEMSILILRNVKTPGSNNKCLQAGKKSFHFE
jgi:hypothetical protein